MPRPKFLQCIMTPEIIRHIKQEQDYYDQNPERYERQQQEAQEQYRQEQEEMIHQMRHEQEKQAEKDYEDYINSQNF